MKRKFKNRTWKTVDGEIKISLDNYTENEMNITVYGVGWNTAITKRALYLFAQELKARADEVTATESNYAYDSFFRATRKIGGYVFQCKRNSSGVFVPYRTVNKIVEFLEFHCKKHVQRKGISSKAKQGTLNL